MKTNLKGHWAIRFGFTDHPSAARIYTTANRAAAAAKRMFPLGVWRRIVEIRSGQYIIDTFGGYLAKGEER